jgi:outer membrane protein insertion porin family
MTLHRKVSCFTSFSLSLFAGLLLLSVTSCVVVPRKQYQKDVPFVFKTAINVSSTSLPPAEKKELEARLENQLDDSLKTRVISYAGVYKRMIRPPVFDTNNVSRSVTFMESLLNAEGFFNPVITDTFTVDTVGAHQQRVTINFDITTGKRTRLDSVGFDLLTPELQQLATRTRERTLLRKNDPYSLQVISDEIDRLLQVFHNNGYYKVSRDDIYAERDTVVAALIDPGLDPFEQIRLLDSLRRKRENPTINIVIKQREAKDTTHLKQFYIGKVTVYPDEPYIPDTTEVITYDSTVLPKNNYKVYYTSNRFKLPFIERHIFLFPDSLYRERLYFRTVNNFNRLGAWSKVDLTLVERYDSVPRLDAELRLYPSLRRNLKVDFEASRNIADYLTTSQFFGLGLNVSFTDRNSFREAIQSSTNARFGIEFGSNFIQTLQTNLSHSIFFPRLIKPKWIRLKNEEQIINPRTVFNINAAYTIRRDIYDVSSINTSWSYEGTVRKGRNRQESWQVSLPNIEFTRLVGKDSLFKLMDRIPSLRYAFNDGFVIGIIAGKNISWAKRNNRISNLKVRIEESGALFGFIKPLEDNNLFRFVKTDIEYKNFINYKRSGWAFRLFGGYGHVYGKKDGQPENKLPFFKAYFAGGPYSMRAWQVRRLGPGSVSIYDTISGGASDRFGNMQLEGNVEYRFHLTTIAGIKVKSALFVDVGNVWGPEFEDASATKKIPDASFNFGRLYKDLAVGAGTSIRFDFDFFLIRLDWAYKLKDPRFSRERGGWFHDMKLFDGQFQLGIGYPF